MDYKIINNKKLLRFEIHEGDEIAFLEYRFYKKDIAFMHTEVPKSREYKGVGSALRHMDLSLQKNIRNK